MLPVRVGRYLLIERLGAGAMAEVFRARIASGEGRGTEVALRRLRPELAGDESRRAQLLREAETARGLHHPIFCAIQEVGELDGLPFLTLELVHGPSLGRLLHVQRLRGRPAPVAAALQILVELCAGLHHAHAPPFGLVHGDVSPANILLDGSGRLKLVDSVGEPDDRALQGTLGYLAPEQLAGAPASAVSDLYACGVLLWELLANRRLFAARTLPEAARLRAAPLPAPSEVAGAPSSLDGPVRAALEPDPALRVASGRELRAAVLAAARQADLRPSSSEVAAWVNRVFPEPISGERPDPQQ